MQHQAFFFGLRYLHPPAVKDISPLPPPGLIFIDAEIGLTQEFVDFSANISHNACRKKAFRNCDLIALVEIQWDS